MDIEADRDLARVRGLRYLDAGAVAKLPVEDVVERVEAIAVRANQPDPVKAAALPGTVPDGWLSVTTSRPDPAQIPMLGGRRLRIPAGVEHTQLERRQSERVRMIAHQA